MEIRNSRSPENSDPPFIVWVLTALGFISQVACAVAIILTLVFDSLRYASIRHFALFVCLTANGIAYTVNLHKLLMLFETLLSKIRKKKIEVETSNAVVKLQKLQEGPSPRTDVALPSDKTRYQGVETSPKESIAETFIRLNKDLKTSTKTNSCTVTESENGVPHTDSLGEEALRNTRSLGLQVNSRKENRCDDDKSQEHSKIETKSSKIEDNQQKLQSIESRNLRRRRGVWLLLIGALVLIIVIDIIVCFYGIGLSLSNQRYSESMEEENTSYTFTTDFINHGAVLGNIYFQGMVAFTEAVR
eukprot:CAMPEP_0167814182 /NCGR_PEP_ID=MMETSP0112_2-20121227/2276_1 /TAXON_ID=91324 /ORGANISM="Lotharella globosa, Strain CCCM811" /LENGTH=302 /DNA_ID=CAMNT_0007713365 /DNA_START=203 /DNA_END=1111 /DNA_ORIENTATION=-